MNQINLPISGVNPYEYQTHSVNSEGSIAIIGANGSGKTRLGTWIELQSEDSSRVSRVSAQKSLSMPGSVSSFAVDQALNTLRYGHPDLKAAGYESQPHHAKMSYRYGSKPATFMLDDFEQLLTYLFSEENQSNREYKLEARSSTGEQIAPPETKLDAIERIWSKVIPHRRLSIGGGKIETGLADDSLPIETTLYNASEMSDGERVIFYLIGQSLSAPDRGILVIDEPELHLHKSIQARLWDAVEAERPDCLFIYLTHDLDFAASRVSATKIWLESYDGTSWTWHEIQQAEEIPEQLYLEIVGGRKPVIFCEGDKGSLDYFLFQKAYPDFTIAPCVNAKGVIGATGSFTGFKHMHRHNCFGIIDRDFKSDKEVEDFKEKGILALDYSEIENVLLSEDVLRLIAQHLRFDDVNNRIEKAKHIVIEQMQKDKEVLVSSITAAKIERLLRKFDSKAKGKLQLVASLTSLEKHIDVESLYDETSKRIEQIIANHDYEEALKIYNNKGLLGKVETHFGFARKGMIELVKRLASGKDSEQMISALRNQLPAVQD